MDDFSLQELFYVFKKRIKLILGFTVGALIISGGISFFVLTPQYETFATLMVGKPKDYQSRNESIEFTDIQLNQQLIHTYGELAKSRSVSDKVIENLNLGMSYEAFQQKIEVNLVEDTEIIKIQASDSDNELAAKIANDVSKEFIDTVQDKMKVENVQIIDKAPIPYEPVSPRKSLNMAIGSILGLMIGVFLTFLLEYLDNTFKTSEEVEKRLQLSVLGSIPEIDDTGKETIVNSNPNSPISEAFKTMRTNIQFTNIDKELKMIAVTSSTAGEGKSTIISNLAISMVQNGKKVLIVDCDMRKPKVAKMFKLPNTKGLTSILMGSKSLEEAIFKYSDIKGLSIITSGPIPPNPSELLSSERMKYFLKSIDEKYDIVIFDTPPIGIVTDAAIISTFMNGTLYVIESGVTDIKQVQHGKDLLEKVDANIIGAVLNKIPTGKGKYGYYNYEQYATYHEEN